MNNVYDKASDASRRAAELYEDLCVLGRMITRLPAESKKSFSDCAACLMLRADLERVQDEAQVVQEALKEIA